MSIRRFSSRTHRLDASFLMQHLARLHASIANVRQDGLLRPNAWASSAELDTD